MPHIPHPSSSSHRIGLVYSSLNPLQLLQPCKKRVSFMSLSVFFTWLKFYLFSIRYRYKKPQKVSRLFFFHRTTILFFMDLDTKHWFHFFFMLVFHDRVVFLAFSFFFALFLLSLILFFVFHVRFFLFCVLFVLHVMFPSFQYFCYSFCFLSCSGFCVISFASYSFSFISTLGFLFLLLFLHDLLFFFINN